MIRVEYVVGASSHVVESDRGDGTVTFTATPELWASMQAGEVDPIVAFMQGRLKMAGDHAAIYDLLPTIPLPIAPSMRDEAR